MIRKALAVSLLCCSAIAAADAQRCVAIAPEHVREWQSNVAIFAQAVSVVPEIDSDSGLIAAWRVEAINTHRLGIDLGLRVGDRILAIDDVPVQETESFMGRLNQLADAGFYSIDLLDEQGQHIVVMVAVADGADCS
jgi:hypothetical protein